MEQVCWSGSPPDFFLSLRSGLAWGLALRAKTSVQATAPGFLVSARPRRVAAALRGNNVPQPYAWWTNAVLSMGQDLLFRPRGSPELAASRSGP